MQSKLNNREIESIILDDRCMIIDHIAKLGGMEGHTALNKNWKVFVEKEWESLAKIIVRDLPISTKNVEREENKMAKIIQRFLRDRMRKLKNKKSEQRCQSNYYFKKWPKSKLIKCSKSMTCRKNPKAKGNKCFTRKR